MTDTLRIINGNGQSVAWTAQQLRNYQVTAPTRSFADAVGRPTTVAIAIDTTWYMTEGPGRYYNPANFSSVANILQNGNSALANLVGSTLQEGQSIKLGDIFGVNSQNLTTTIYQYKTDVGITGTPYQLHQYTCCDTALSWPACLASLFPICRTT